MWERGVASPGIVVLSSEECFATRASRLPGMRLCAASLLSCDGQATPGERTRACSPFGIRAREIERSGGATTTKNPVFLLTNRPGVLDY